MTQASFPPLFIGQAVTGALNPFDKSCSQAMLGCDAGLVVHNISPDTLRAAIVFAPEVTLEEAMVMLPTCGIGFQNALGALAPPEVAVHLTWDGLILINGARCGRLRVAASHQKPGAVAEWLVIGLELPLWPASDNPGETPNDTALYAEGCADVDAVHLLESWVRHSLVWINRWQDEGASPLHTEWRGLAHGVGETTEQNGQNGKFLGTDERFGMLLRSAETTHLIPLSTLLET